MPFCSACGKEGAKPCSQCKIAHYCDRRCQRADWEGHRQRCSDVNAYQLSVGERKDIVWKADDMLGRAVAHLTEKQRAFVRSAFDRKVAFYSAPMPGTEERYLRCVLIFTGMEPPAKIDDGEDESPLIFYRAPKK